ncbi:hypothetical protein HOD20_08615, partial [archaeon]|nr:hypothetical protein [archaeon]
MSDSPIEDIVIKEYTSHQTDEFIKVLEESEKGTVYSWIEPIIFEEQKTKFAFIYENKVHLYDRKQESINENDELNNAMTNIFKKIEEKKHISYTGRVEIKPEEKL